MYVLQQKFSKADRVTVGKVCLITKVVESRVNAR